MAVWIYKGIMLVLLVIVGAALEPERPAHNDGLAADFGGFGTGGTIAGAPLSINDVAVGRDGTIVAVGSRDNTFAVARFNADGTLETGFGNGGLVVTRIVDAQTRAAAQGVALQPDGKIVVAGTVYGVGGSDIAVLRYTPDGALDAGFGRDGVAIVDFDGGDDSAEAVAIDFDGHIVVAGSAGRGDSSDFAALRLFKNGTLDRDFDDDGKARVDFGGAAVARDLLLRGKDGLVLAGHAQVAGEQGATATHFAVAQLDLDGAKVPEFDGDGKLTTAITGDDRGSSAALHYDGKLVVAGSGASSAFVLARYNPDGSLDKTFDGDGKVVLPFGATENDAVDMLAPGDGTIIVAGQSDGQMALARVNSDGALEPSFDGDGKLLLDISPLDSEAAYTLARAYDGRLVTAGGQVMARLFDDGSLDASGRQLAAPQPEPASGPAPPAAAYDPQAVDSGASATLAQPDGKIVSAGTVYYREFGADIALTRYMPDGRPDPSFGSDSEQTVGMPESLETAADALLQPRDGKIVVVGTARQTPQDDSDLLLARFNPDGSLDDSCAATGLASVDIFENNDDAAHAVALQADGKIVVAVTVSYIQAPESYTVLARFDTNCELDTEFGDEGIVWLETADPVEVLALRDGKILAVDNVELGYAVLARFDADGSPDSSFGGEGRRELDLGGGALSAAAELPNGKLLLAGGRETKNGDEALLVRLTSDGDTDTTFGEEGMAATELGAENFPYDLAVSGSGTIALAGCGYDRATAVPAVSAAPVALFTAGGELDRGFSGDGKTELAIGGRTCATAAAFSGTRLVVGGYAANGATFSFALAAYPTGGEQRAVGFAPAPATVVEAAGTATLVVSLSQTAAETVTVQYAATGSATNGADYTLASGTLRFAPGETSRRIGVTIGDDKLDEPDETLIISLSNPSNAILGGTGSLTLTIADDDLPAAHRRIFLPIGQR